MKYFVGWTAYFSAMLLLVGAVLVVAAASPNHPPVFPNYNRLIHNVRVDKSDHDIFIVTEDDKQTIFLDGVMVANDRISRKGSDVVFAPIPGYPNAGK